MTNISLIGNGVTVDSFDSSNPNYSDWNTNWGYGTYDSSKDTANAIVETDSDLINAISIGAAQIYGKINTGPGGTIGISSNGYVGPIPQAGNGIQPGYSNDTANITFPDVPSPPGASGWQSIPANNVITISGNYYSPGITSSLTINAPHVTIYVAGDLSITGNNAIFITTNATSVTLYIAGPSVAVSGLASINNLAERASVLSIYGLPTLTSINLGGNGGFTGTIYAPEANIFLSSAGNNTKDFIGSIAAWSLRLAGHINFHFDESLTTNTTSPLWFTAPAQTTATIVGYGATLSAPFQGQSMACQWFLNQTNALQGATNPTLTITNAQLSDAGSYYLVATNLAGAATSAPINLVVYTNVSMNLSPVQINTNGTISLFSSIPPGFTVTAQASTNLSDWVSIGTKTSYLYSYPPFTNLSFPLYFGETFMSNCPQRYYRVVFDLP